MRCAFVVTFLMALAIAPFAHAAELPVTSSANDGAGSIRAQIAAAGNGDVVIVPDPRTLPGNATKYALTSELVVQDKDIAIRGAGARLVTLDAGQTGRVLAVRRVNATTALALSGVTVTGGKVTNDGEAFGGGIFVGTQASLQLSESAVVGNLVDAPMANGSGGGIAAFGFVNVTQSLIADNTARNTTAAVDSFGGGLWSATANAIVRNSTVTANKLESPGGGATNGGGVAATGNSTVTLSFSTVARNTASSGGNIAAFGGSASIFQSIVDEGSCAGPVTDGGTSVIDGPGCVINPNLGSDGADPMLDTQLRDNGGPTDTLRLLPGSPAVEQVPVNTCIASQTDQRGLARPSGPMCDAGAYEVRPPSLGTPSAAAQSNRAHATAPLTPAMPGTVRVGYGVTADDLSSVTTPVPYTPSTTVAHADITGLDPGRVYFFRFMASSGDGDAVSPVATFSTLRVPPTPPPTTPTPTPTPTPTATATPTPGCTVPKLKGLKLKRAKQRLRAAGCRAGTVTRKAAKRKRAGRVLRQQVRAGAELAAGAKVALVVGKKRR